MQTMGNLPLFPSLCPPTRWSISPAHSRGADGRAAHRRGMAALSWFGQLDAALLLLDAFQLGVAAAFTMPAWQALMPEIVGKEQLSLAITLRGIGYKHARAPGP